MKSSLQVIENNLRRHDYVGAPPVLLNMVRAIKRIVKALRANPSARFGRYPTTSPGNLSRVVHESIKPACERLWVLHGLNAASVPVILTAEAKPYEVFLAEEEIKRLADLIPVPRNAPEKQALDLLYGALGHLRNNFSPRKYTKKSEDAPWCKYCYREVMVGADTCHIHDAHRRTLGEYHYERYTSLMLIAKQRRLLEGSAGSGKDFPLTHALLEEKNVPAWSGQKPAEIETWIAHVLQVLDACNPIVRGRVAAEIAASEKLINRSRTNEKWPSSLKGTLFRHEIYLLAHLRQPSHEIADRLNQIWSGETVVAVALKCRVSRQILHRQVSKWGSEIQALRIKGVRDNVIKLIYSLDALPPHKSD